MKAFTRREVLHYSLLATAASGLAACVAPTGPSVPPAAAPAAEATAVAPPRTVTLQYFVGFGAGGSPQQVEAGTQLFDQFTAENPNIKVEYIIASGTAASKFQAMVAAGTPPDFLTMGMSQWNFAAKGAFVDIKPLAERDGINMDDFEQNAIDAYTVKPKDNMLYGLPYSVGVGDLCYYNTELWDKAGLEAVTDWNDPSWTWDALMDAARKMTIRSGDTVTQWGMWQSPWIWDIPWMFGGDWASADLNTFTLNTPQAIKGFAFEQDELFREKVAPAGADTQAFPGGFTSGNVGLFITGSWVINTYLDLGDELKWGILPMPVAPEVGLKPRCSAYYPDAFVISSKNAVQESWEVIKWQVMEDEPYRAFCEMLPALPSRTSQRRSFFDAFFTEKNPNVNWEIFWNVFDYAQVCRLFLNINWTELNNMLSSEVAALWTNETTPEELIPSLHDKMADLWQRGVELVS